MKKKNKQEFDCVKSFPQCIQWNLGNIPSLSIVNGDYLDDIVYAVVNKLCELSDPLDVSSLSLQCLIDKLDNTEPTPKTIQTILQLVIDNECTLKDLIDNLQSQINDISGSTLTLNLKCLAQYDVYGNPLPYDTKSVLQSLINELCILKTQVAYLSTVVVDLQNQIDAIDVTPYVLPTVTNCISTSKRLDLSLGEVATSLCNLRTATGTESQLQIAIGNQCSNFNTQFSTITGWNSSPSNLAQSYSNLELAFCNLLTRVIAIEQTCCAPSCDKIKIGFNHSYDYDTRELTLSFTSGAGTIIPSGFEDCGSEFTIKNCSGDVILVSVQPIAADAELVFVLPQGSCIDDLTISIKTKFCLFDIETVILTCRDCVSKDIKIQGECCVLTNTNEEDVVLIYEITAVSST